MRNGKPAVKLFLVTPLVCKSRKHLRGSGIGAQEEVGMKVLVATPTFRQDLLSDHRSSRLANQIKSDEHELYFSLVSLWEVAIKMKTGKLNALGSSVAYLHAEMENYSMQLLPIRYVTSSRSNPCPPTIATPSIAS